jgi:hypothetical protein
VVVVIGEEEGRKAGGRLGRWGRRTKAVVEAARPRRRRVVVAVVATMAIRKDERRRCSIRGREEGWCDAPLLGAGRCERVGREGGRSSRWFR